MTRRSGDFVVNAWAVLLDGMFIPGILNLEHPSGVGRSFPPDKVFGKDSRPYRDPYTPPKERPKCPHRNVRLSHAAMRTIVST